MQTQELKIILEETLEEPVASISTVGGDTPPTSKGFFDIILGSYDGLLELASGEKLAWSLTVGDDDDWSLMTRPV